MVRCMHHSRTCTRIKISQNVFCGWFHLYYCLNISLIAGCPPAYIRLDYELDSCVREVAYTTWRKFGVTEQNNGLLRKKYTKYNLVFHTIEFAASCFLHWQQLHLVNFIFSYSCLWLTLSFLL
jgi:hypothetical protein